MKHLAWNFLRIYTRLNSAVALSKLGDIQTTNYNLYKIRRKGKSGFAVLGRNTWFMLLPHKTEQKFQRALMI
jgi:hypothetical protein